MFTSLPAAAQAGKCTRRCMTESARPHNRCLSVIYSLVGSEERAVTPDDCCDVKYEDTLSNRD